MRKQFNYAIRTWLKNARKIHGRVDVVRVPSSWQNIPVSSALDLRHFRGAGIPCFQAPLVLGSYQQSKDHLRDSGEVQCCFEDDCPPVEGRVSIECVQGIRERLCDTTVGEARGCLSDLLSQGWQLLCHFSGFRYCLWYILSCRFRKRHVGSITAKRYILPLVVSKFK